MSNQQHAPNFSLAGKVTVVTGASRGIGRACALACAAAGSDMVLGVRNPAKVADMVAEIEGMGRKAIAVELDIPNKDHIAGVIKAAVDTFGRIDILVNNVGVAPGGLAEERRRKRRRCDPRYQHQGHVPDAANAGVLNEAWANNR